MSDQPAKNLGEFLRSERERRGLSIEQVSSATKIGIKVLYALEANQYGELPALPFVRGFIRNYAKFIGLDSEKLLEDYKDFLAQQSKQRPNRDAGHSGYAFERPEGEQSRKMLWAIMGSMVVLGGLVVFVFKPSLKHRRHGHIEQIRVSPSPSPSMSAIAGAENAPAAVIATTSAPLPVPSVSVVAASPSPPPKASPSPMPSVVASAIPSPSPVVPVVAAPPSPTPPPAKPSPSPVASVAATSPSPVPSPAVSAKPDPLQSGVDYTPAEVRYKVLVKALEDVWVRYQCDDKKLMKFVLKKDRILVLRGKNTIRFQASNPDSISYSPNGLAYRSMATSEHQFDFQGTPSLVWPLKDREKIQEVMGSEKSLPQTPGPILGTESTPPPAGI